MIHGIGTDIVDIRRIKAAIDKFGDRFANKILSCDEREEYDSLSIGEQPRFLAKRFAIKEAAAKALGTGFREGVALKDFSLSHDPLGKPLLQLNGRAEKISEAKQLKGRYISLSDEKNYVIAYATLTR
jgi:holo-[acyl-carrier protein] synthase